jgi:hypothetical protein
LTLQELEKNGYTVRVHHRRITEAQLRAAEEGHMRLKKDVPEVPLRKFEIREMQKPIATRGGYTKVEIFKGEEMVAEGEAWCNTIDNFNKRLGREIALGRALKALKEYA